MAITGTDATEVQKEEVIDPRCIVKFRPADDWKGEYGFDWFREGDCGEVFNNGSSGGTTYCTYEYADGNPVVDSNGNDLEAEIKSISDYENDKMIGVYGDQIGFISSNFSVQSAYKNYIYVSNKFYFDNNQTLYHYEKKHNGKWIVRDSNGAVLKYRVGNNELEEEFDYDEVTETMNNCRGCKELENNRNDLGEGELYGVDPDMDIYSFHYDQRNDSGETIDSKMYEKKYFSLDIKDGVTGSLIGNYHVPYISLFCLGKNKDILSGLTDNNVAVNALSDSSSEELGEWRATVKLLIEAKDVDRIKFYCDEGVTCEPSEIKINNGESKKKVVISNLSRKYPVKEELAFVTVKAAHGKNDPNPTIAGRICVVKYPPKKVDVVVVPILSRINKEFVLPILKQPIDIRHPIDSINENFDLSKEERYLKQYLSQAQIVPSIRTRRIQKKELLKKIEKLIQAATVNGEVLTKTNDGVQYEDGTEVKKGTKLHVVFEDIFEKDLEKHEMYLKDALKVFYIQAKGDCLGQTAGFPNQTPKPPKNVIVFDHKNYPITICHELLHRLGLFHSFSNMSPYTFEKFRTSNIMDYPVEEGLKQQSLWKWQWDEIRKFDEMKDIDDQNPYRLIV